VVGHDQGDAATWPRTNDIDGWFWEPGSAEADEPTAAERADFESWLAPVDRDYPPPSQVSDQELAMIAAGMAI
jgi:hypothetical protein